MSRSNIAIVLLVVFIVIVALFPTAHTRIRKNLVKTIDCYRTLADGESLQESLTDMQDKTRIRVNIVSNEGVQVFLTGINDSTTLDIYSLVKNIHIIQHTEDYTSYNITVWNPHGPDSGSSANMSGDIKVYHVWDDVEWLPWWMR